MARMDPAPAHPRVRWQLALVSLVVVAAVAVGIWQLATGGSGKSGDPRQTLVDFYAAVAARDAGKACALLTRSAAAIEQAGVGDCAHSVRAFDALAIAVGGQRVLDRLLAAVNAARAKMKVAVNGDSAVVTVPGEAAGVRLHKVGGRWLINQSLSSMGSPTTTPSK